MIPTNVKRPRNVDWKRAAAILYGDWGTSKAYVIGLAFAVAGYASFWLIALMCMLTALVGLNYMIICRLYPDGGGVYASVRHRSEVISIVGAIAKLLMPGKDPGGCIITMLLGIAGAFVGTWIGRVFAGENYVAGWIMSILGAMILLLLYRLIFRRS